MEKKSLQKNFRIALTGALCALTFVLGITHLGYITINPAVSYTILQVPAILAAILAGPLSAAAVGFSFGLTSFLQANIAPSSILSPCFLNPLVSILPRIIFAVCACAIFSFFEKILRIPKIVSAAISAFLASMLNTIFVFGAIILFCAQKDFFVGIQERLGFSALTNFNFFVALILANLPAILVEAGFSAFLAVCVTTSNALSKKNKKSKFLREIESEEKF